MNHSHVNSQSQFGLFSVISPDKLIPALTTPSMIPDRSNDRISLLQLFANPLMNFYTRNALDLLDMRRILTNFPTDPQFAKNYQVLSEAAKVSNKLSLFHPSNPCDIEIKGPSNKSPTDSESETQKEKEVFQSAPLNKTLTKKM